MSNIIDSVTEPSFTQTGKGLMTIFVIGLIKIVIGVHFTSTEISIPWLPTIHLDNLNNITYLYTLLILYALVRYKLHNNKDFKLFLIKSLAKGFKSGHLGRLFISHYILDKNKPYTSKENTSGNNHIVNQSVEIVSYSCEFPTESFHLVFDDNRKINRVVSTLDPGYGERQKALTDKNLNERWGGFIELKQNPEDDRSPIVFESFRINDVYIKIIIYFISKYYQIKFTWQHPNALDLYLPWLCNILLLCMYILKLIEPSIFNF